MSDVAFRFVRSTQRTLVSPLANFLFHLSLRLVASSDFISGFCGETQADHEATLKLLREVQYDHAFLFAYSQREKTHAHRQFADDVSEPVKQVPCTLAIFIFAFLIAVFCSLVQHEL